MGGPAKDQSIEVDESNRARYDATAFGGADDVVPVDQGSLSSSARVGGCLGEARGRCTAT